MKLLSLSLFASSGALALASVIDGIDQNFLFRSPPQMMAEDPVLRGTRFRRSLAESLEDGTPRTLLWNGTELAELRKLVLGKNVPSWAKKPLKNLKRYANKKKSLPEGIRPNAPAGPWSPTQKTTLTSPDGDQRSFATFKGYMWPCTYTCSNAKKANPKIKKNCSMWNATSKRKPSKKWKPCNETTGMPYVGHDGFTNPDAGLDKQGLIIMIESLETLTLAWWFTDDSEYSKAAMDVFTTWFINATTRMNPHMKYAALVPGKNGSKPSLITASHRWHARLNDIVALLSMQGEEVWTGAVSKAWEDWRKDWFQWWTDADSNGAMYRYNNHASWYYVHTLAMAYSLGNHTYIKDTFSKLWSFLPGSFVEQIEPSGEMPAESARVAGLTYSLMNLEALVSLAIMARNYCDLYACSDRLDFAKASNAVSGGTWNSTPNARTQCKQLSSQKGTSEEDCRNKCLNLTSAPCSAVNIRQNGDKFACSFQDCRGEVFEKETASGVTMHTYTRPMAAGRGSVKNAFDYLAKFADQRKSNPTAWVDEHPTDASDVSNSQWKRLGRLSRMISTTLVEHGDEYEARASTYDKTLWKHVESLVFPPPGFTASNIVESARASEYKRVAEAQDKDPSFVVSTTASTGLSISGAQDKDFGSVVSSTPSTGLSILTVIVMGRIFHDI